MARESASLRYRKRRSGGLCTRGSCDKPPVDGKRLCEAHLDRVRQYSKDYRNRRRESGLCTRGSCNNPAVDGVAHCEDHRNYFRQERSKRIKNGLCGEKGCHNPLVEGKTHCEEHLIKRRNDHTRKLGHTSVSKKAAIDEQDGLCPITGRILNASAPIDHDHQTGARRDILDSVANKLLGFYEYPLVKPRKARSFIEYIIKHDEKFLRGEYTIVPKHLASIVDAVFRDRRVIKARIKRNKGLLKLDASYEAALNIVKAEYGIPVESESSAPAEGEATSTGTSNFGWSTTTSSKDRA